MTQTEQPDRTTPPPAPAVRAVGVIGLFGSPEPLLRAAERFRDAGFKHWDCHTPYPVHGLDRAMGLRPSPMGTVTLTGGGVGFVLAVLMTGGLSVFQYPLRIGGKPLFSWQAFVPIFFELFVLLATLSTFVALIVMCKLGRWHSPLHDTGVMKEITCDQFAIVLRGDAATEDQPALEKARRILADCGCPDVRPLMEEA